MRKLVMVLSGLMLLAATGCGPGVGYVVKPVPLSDQLAESVISADGGWFVYDKIAIVDVDGLIFNDRNGGLFGMGDNPVAVFVEKMDKAQGDPNVKAVVLRINSPGGGVCASDIMYQRVMDFRAARKGVPVIAMIEDVGASGGYYVACAADSIMAHPTSITGSIGVLVQTVSFAGTMQKIGVTAKAITSGEYKDMGSPLKPLEDKDAAVIKVMVDDFYGRFKTVVAGGRPKLTADDVARLADGRVYTGEQARANGLVDELGYMPAAIREAKLRCGSKRVKVVMYHRPWGSRQTTYSAAQDVQPQVNLINISMPHMAAMTQPQFLYLWTGK